VSKSGQNNYKGVTYQAWAALLLFLLKLDEGGFSSITLEDSEWEDFTLNYGATKKIICEAKNYAKPLGVPEVKKILNNILSSNELVGAEDEILIICPEVKPEITNNLKYIKWASEIVNEYKRLGFSSEEISLLAKTSFFIAKDSEYLYQEALTYFYAKINYWLPQNEVDGLVNTVLVRQIYEKSTKGETFSRQELAAAIDNYVKDKIKQNGVYDSEQTEVEAQIKTVLDDIRNKRATALKRDLTALTGQPQKMFIVLDAIFKTRNLILADWDFLWSELLDRQYAFSIMHDFEKFIDDENNAGYILKLFTGQVPALTNKAVDRFHGEYALTIVQKILDKHPTLKGQALSFIEKYFDDKTTNYLDLDRPHNSGTEKNNLAEILLRLFELFPIESSQQSTILKLVNKHFNLVDDDGEHSIYTPPQVFEILKRYLEEDLERNLEKVVALLVEQYNNASRYSGKLPKFSGWELMGGTFSQSGHHYSIDDRHYISYCLRPALTAYHMSDPVHAWTFIKANCISQKIKDVSADRPDFLTRASIPVLLEEFRQGASSKEAFKILKAIMFMRRGIPAKFELIFQELYRSEEMPDEKKWAITAEFIEKYGLPNSVFVEQVTSDLAMKGNDGALDAIKAWVNDPTYRERQTRHTFFVSQSMFKLLDTPAESKTFVAGIEILKAYLNTEDYSTKLDTFHAYDVTVAITKVISKDFDLGIGILKELYALPKLTTNQQLAIWHPIEQLDKEDKDLLGRAYREFVRPILIGDLGAKNDAIEQRFPYRYARELIVQFAEHLGGVKLLEEALEVVRIFVNDTNPTLENEPDDKEGTFNYHARIKAGEDQITINTVRGWCAWALQKFSVVAGRPYLEEAVGLVEKLSQDSNLYVRVQSTFALSAFVLNRHTFMPGTGEQERFMSLALAQKIEDIAFAMLKDPDNTKYKAVTTHLLHVFNGMRTLTNDQAREMLEAYKVVSFDEEIEDVYGLLIYYALFRKNAFEGERMKRLFGDELYGRINNFEDREFKDLLESAIRNGNDDARSRIAWQFWQMPKKAESDFERLFGIAIRYLSIFTERYTHHAYERLYYFAKDFVDDKPEECLELWEKALRKEYEFVQENAEKLKPGEWWTGHYHGELLAKYRERFDDQRYLDMLGMILDYPSTVYTGIKPELIYDELKVINSAKSKKLLKKLCDQNPRLYSRD
jgi:hypothetical protein